MSPPPPPPPPPESKGILTAANASLYILIRSTDTGRLPNSDERIPTRSRDISVGLNCRRFCTRHRQRWSTKPKVFKQPTLNWTSWRHHRFINDCLTAFETHIVVKPLIGLCQVPRKKRRYGLAQFFNGLVLAASNPPQSYRKIVFLTYVYCFFSRLPNIFKKP